jgi:hypothetical protein
MTTTQVSSLTTTQLTAMNSLQASAFLTDMMSSTQIHALFGG